MGGYADLGEYDMSDLGRTVLSRCCHLSMCGQVQERALAEERNYPCPVYDTLPQTHHNYKMCTVKLLDNIHNTEVII